MDLTLSVPKLYELNLVHDHQVSERGTLQFLRQDSAGASLPVRKGSERDEVSIDPCPGGIVMSATGLLHWLLQEQAEAV